MPDLPDPPPPYVLAMLICDSVYVDPSTGKKTLLGLFSAIFGETFPLRIPMMALFVALTDGRGVTPIRMKLVDSEEQKPAIFESEMQFDFTDPRMVAELLTGMVNIEFPEAGEYRLQLFACNTLLMERRIIVSTSPEPAND